MPRYLPYLWNRFLSSGGQAFRTTLPSLSALLSEKDRPALEAFPPTSSHAAPIFNPAALINCTGIGALSMGDVLGRLFCLYTRRYLMYFSDTNVYPTRGEVLIIRAPWIHHGSSCYFKDNHLSYVIPRQSGDAILGGTFQPDDWCVSRFKSSH